MHILFFAINIIWLVLLEDLIVWMMLWAVQFVFFVIWKIHHKEALFMFLYKVLLGIFVPVISVFLSNYFYFDNLPEYDDTYIWTGQIVDSIDSDRYVFEDNEWREYIFYSDEDYQAGDIINTFAFFSPWLTECEICNSFHELLNYQININFDFEDLIYEYEYERWLMLQNYYWTMWENNSIFEYKDELGYLYSAKAFVKWSLESNFGENKYAWLAQWVLIWDRSLIPSFEYQNFLDTGLVHIIATSGTHVAFLVLFLSIVLFWVPLYLRIPLILVGLSFYALMVGLSANIFRAWIMGGLTLLAVLAGRSTNVWRLIITSFVIILCISPYSILYDMWFALSFSALIGIVLLQSFVGKPKSIFWKVYGQYIHPSIWASLGVFPFLLFFVNQINLTTVAANFLVLPLLPVLMLLSFAGLWFDFEYLVFVQSYLADRFYFVADFFSRYGVYVIVEDYFFKLFFVISFLLVVIILQKKT